MAVIPLGNQVSQILKFAVPVSVTTTGGQSRDQHCLTRKESGVENVLHEAFVHETCLHGKKSRLETSERGNLGSERTYYHFPASINPLLAKIMPA
jgi:hypothetical protein